MFAEIKTLTSQGKAEIRLSVPAGSAAAVEDAIRSMLTLAGHKVRLLNEEDEEIVSAAEVFPDGSPAMALRGFRGKMEMSQQELADKLGTARTSIVAMESGSRPISRAMAKRLGEVFNISYKVFL